MRFSACVFAFGLVARALAADSIDVRQTGQNPCVLNAFSQLLTRGEGILGRVEAAAFLVRNDDATFAMHLWPRRDFTRQETFRGTIPAGTVAIIHTHPHVSPQPSRGDVAEAIRLGLPIYVVSFWEVWAADTSGEQVSIVAKGRWSRDALRNGCAMKVTDLSR